MSLRIVNLYDLVDAMGEAEAEKILSACSCPKNSEVERFLHTQALDFAHAGIGFCTAQTCRHLSAY